jgi:hypothetical protein
MFKKPASKAFAGVTIIMLLLLVVFAIFGIPSAIYFDGIGYLYFLVLTIVVARGYLQYWK